MLIKDSIVQVSTNSETGKGEKEAALGPIAGINNINPLSSFPKRELTTLTLTPALRHTQGDLPIMVYTLSHTHREAYTTMVHPYTHREAYTTIVHPYTPGITVKGGSREPLYPGITCKRGSREPLYPGITLKEALGSLSGRNNVKRGSRKPLWPLRHGREALGSLSGLSDTVRRALGSPFWCICLPGCVSRCPCLPGWGIPGVCTGCVRGVYGVCTGCVRVYTGCMTLLGEYEAQRGLPASLSPVSLLGKNNSLPEPPVSLLGKQQRTLPTTRFTVGQAEEALPPPVSLLG